MHTTRYFDICPNDKRESSPYCISEVSHTSQRVSSNQSIQKCKLNSVNVMGELLDRRERETSKEIIYFTNQIHDHNHILPLSQNSDHPIDFDIACQRDQRSPCILSVHAFSMHQTLIQMATDLHHHRW